MCVQIKKNPFFSKGFLTIPRLDSLTTFSLVNRWAYPNARSKSIRKQALQAVLHSTRSAHYRSPVFHSEHPPRNRLARRAAHNRIHAKRNNARANRRNPRRFGPIQPVGRAQLFLARRKRG